MADEDGQQQSIHDRIAALNLGHLGRAPITATPAKRPVPKPPIKRGQTANIPTVSSRTNDIGNEPNGPNGPNGRDILPAPQNVIRTGQMNGNRGKPALPPHLPPRSDSVTQANRLSPALPTRRPSSQLSRRGSQESISSAVSSVSGFSNGVSKPASRTPSIDRGRIRAPVYDPASLPPLPPKRAQTEKDRQRVGLNATKPSASVATNEPKASIRPPSLPQRASTNDTLQITRGRKLPPSSIPPLPSRSSPNGAQTSHGLPTPEPTLAPPVPTNTRPDLSRIVASKPKFPTSTSLSNRTDVASETCLRCQDFTAVDAHAARLPRKNVRSMDWLATQLTSPFPTATEKARAIFTWLHHNVSYDVEAFFNNRVQPSTPASTLSTGLAVCEGYAALFTAIATKCGLESIVVGGHGKGFGYNPPTPNSPLPPPDPTGHAWNAVKLDGGEWKLIDCCWGAGAVGGAGQPYRPGFNPAQFTMDNCDFGRRHFPQNRAHFFRTDGRASISWEEYMRGDVPGGLSPVLVYSNVAPAEGFSTFSFQPKQGKLALSNPGAYAIPGGARNGMMVRFQFERVCAHWDPVRNGPGAPYPYVLALGQGDGGKPAREFVPFESNGFAWWVDVEVERLGVRGEKVLCYSVETLGAESGRGVTKREYEAVAERKGKSFGGVACWELV